jgi:hypothetical protein
LSLLSWELTYSANTIATGGYLSYGLILSEYPALFSSFLCLDLLCSRAEVLHCRKELAQIKYIISSLMFIGIFSKFFDYNTPAEWLYQLQNNPFNIISPLALYGSYTALHYFKPGDILFTELVFTITGFMLGDSLLPASLYWRFILSIVLPSITYLLQQFVTKPPFLIH